MMQHASWHCDCALFYIDVQCDPSEASYQAVKSIELHKDHKVLFFFGGACSLETEPLASLAGNFYKIPTVSNYS